ncbi:hypothetical protein [Rhizobium halophytocola]|uniref:Uncharacterized protein n=1 Tax=Rhizobium halophytocola TaxID=735519 RepID=A0ABS4E5U3_9HYPH|nr:hypothetical protein [Rhizobium halophytocola]MBP1853319.1 hypothetical protein [Rhizobium halophytocola]
MSKLTPGEIGNGARQWRSETVLGKGDRQWSDAPSAASPDKRTAIHAKGKHDIQPGGFEVRARVSDRVQRTDFLPMACFHAPC